MRRNIFLFAVAAVSILFPSCSSDMSDDIAVDNDLSTVNFHVTVAGLSNAGSRALAPGYSFADGSSISELKCYVYYRSDGENAAPAIVKDISLSETDGVVGGDVSLSMTRGVLFDIVFLGTSIPQDNPSSKLYYSQTERVLSVDYSQVPSSDEELDCFFAAMANLVSGSASYDDVLLSRPFAQLNIGTQDYDAYNAANPVKDFAVSVGGVYSKVNLMDGSLVGDAATVNFSAAPAPSGQAFPLDGFSYVSMNYLLVNLRTLVDVSLTVNHINSAIAPKVIPLGQMAVERNCQTNAFSKSLLTDFTLE